MRLSYTNFSADIFPGFYESLFYNSDFLCDEFYGEAPEGFDFDFLEGGFERYCRAVSEEWTERLSERLEGNPVGLTVIGLAGIDSPKEYNFRDDRVTLILSVDIPRLRRFCLGRKHRKEFDGYLRENWSDRPGFWSFVPNSADRFECVYREDTLGRSDLREVMIEFYLLRCVDFGELKAAVYESRYEMLDGNLCLESVDDGSKWDYEYTDDGYKPTVRVSQEAAYDEAGN